MTDGPLAGVRVTDLTSVIMGPYATRILADLGADVIKIEPPDGDVIRQLEPMRSDRMSGMTLNLNRNKRSVVLDLKDDAARDALRRIIASSDVFVTNLRPKALEALSLTYDHLVASKEDLIFCSACGFGSNGPYADKAAYDDVIQAASGLSSLFTRVQGEPSFVPTAICDKVAGLHIVYAVTAALYRRAMTGRGDNIEVPMAETMAAFNLVEHLHGHTFSPPLGSFGHSRLLAPGRRPRRSADGWICVMPYTDANWAAFWKIAQRPDVAEDPRFASVNSRVENVDALHALLDELIATRTTRQWIDDCDAASIPAMEILDLEHLDTDRHFRAIGLLRDEEHPTEGPYRRTSDPLRFASGGGELRRHAPVLGEHTAEVLAEVGCTEAEIRRLTSVGVECRGGNDT